MPSSNCSRRNHRQYLAIHLKNIILCEFFDSKELFNCDSETPPAVTCACFQSATPMQGNENCLTALAIAIKSVLSIVLPAFLWTEEQLFYNRFPTFYL